MDKKKGRTQTDWKSLEELFSRYLQGHTEATHRLFTELLRVLQGYFGVRMNFSADVDDLAQATLLKIHFARDRFDPKQSLKTWIFTIASRSLIDHWRGASSEARLDDPVSPGGDESSVSLGDTIPSDLLDPAEKTQLHQDLNQALQTLKPMERSIVYLYGVEGLTMAEIASSLSITETAAKLRAHRAYQELRRLLVILTLTLALPLIDFWKDFHGRH